MRRSTPCLIADGPSAVWNDLVLRGMARLVGLWFDAHLGASVSHGCDFGKRELGLDQPFTIDYDTACRQCWKAADEVFIVA